MVLFLNNVIISLCHLKSFNIGARGLFENFPELCVFLSTPPLPRFYLLLFSITGFHGSNQAVNVPR